MSVLRCDLQVRTAEGVEVAVGDLTAVLAALAAENVSVRVDKVRLSIDYGRLSSIQARQKLVAILAAHHIDWLNLDNPRPKRRLALVES